MMLLGVDTSRVLAHQEAPTQMPREFPLKIYTGANVVEAGQWAKVGSDTSTPIDPNITLRIVANQVYLGDQVIRAVTPEDRQRLPIQRIAGGGAVEEQIQQALDGKASA
jgi:hypothetical protein